MSSETRKGFGKMSSSVPGKADEHHIRDDAEDQPESGYPEGHMSTKLSAQVRGDEGEAQKGSEAEFDSEKVQR